MKQIYIILLVVLMQATYAQNDLKKYRWGGLGYGSIGYTLLNINQKDFPLEGIGNANLSSNGLQFGGGGFLLFGSRFIVSGHGYGSVFDLNDLQNVDLTSTYGGGHLNLGYVLYNRNSLLLFPAVGAGGSGYRVEVMNLGAAPTRFGNQAIPSQSVAEFELPQTYLDININLHKLVDFGDDNDEGGISFGVSLGYQVSLGYTEWRVIDSNDPVLDIAGNQIQSFYFRLHIGGGGFEY